MSDGLRDTEPSRVSRRDLIEASLSVEYCGGEGEGLETAVDDVRYLLALSDRYSDALRDILDLKAGWTAIPSSDAARLLDQADSFARQALEPAS